MKKLLPALLAALLLLSLTACGGGPASAASSAPAASSGAASSSEEPAPPPEPTPEELAAQQIEDTLASLSLAQKVGQLFFVRCPAEGAAEDVTEYHLGGYLLFGRDFQDAQGAWLTADAVSANIQSYQSAAESDSGIPLLIGVDEEGGTVVRVSRNPLLRERKFSSPQKLYASGGLDAIVRDTAEKDALLASLGINVNLAPVCDVSTDPEDFIYDRAFGQDAAATSTFVSAVVSQARQDGMGSVLKHFPGYGNNVDTHTGIARDSRDLETFENSDFLPFHAGFAAGQGTAAVLVSHNIVECMDPELPASLSPAVHRTLRDDLGFAGVAMTDDLAMDAVQAYAKDGAVAVLALQAGNDLIITTDYRTQIPAVLSAIAEGTLSESDIDAACRRVLQWKQSLNLLG